MGTIVELEKEFKETKNIEEKISLSKQIADHYNEINKKSELAYKNYGTHFFLLGEYEAQLGKIEGCLQYFQKSFEYYNSINNFGGLKGLLKKCWPKIYLCIDLGNFDIATEFAKLNAQLLDSCIKLNTSTDLIDVLQEDKKINEATIVEIEIKLLPREDHKQRAELHLKASKLWNELFTLNKNEEWERNFFYHSANYGSARGQLELHAENYVLARQYFLMGHDYFEKLGSRDPTFSCAASVLFTYYKEFETGRYNLKELEQKVAEFREKFSDFKSDKRYLDSLGRGYKALSEGFRRERKFPESQKYTKKALDLYTEFTENSLDSHLKYGKAWMEYFYFQGQLREVRSSNKTLLEKAQTYQKIIDQIKDIIKNIENPTEKEKLEKSLNDEISRYYQLLAFANKYDKIKFNENIDLSIKFSKESLDERSAYYSQGLKFEHNVVFEKELDKKIELLTLAKTNFFRAQSNEAGKAIELLVDYYVVKKLALNRSYDKAILLIDSIAKKSKVTKKIHPILLDIEKEKYILSAKKNILAGNLTAAITCISNWLAENLDIKETRKYLINESFLEAIKIINKKTYTEREIYAIQNKIHAIFENKLGKDIYMLTSLSYCFMLLKKFNLSADNIYEQIKIAIIKIATDEELSTAIEKETKIQEILQEKEWLNLLPTSLLNEYDKNEYFLNDVLNEFKDSAIQRFYKLISTVFLLMLEYHLQKVWGLNWGQKCLGALGNDKQFGKWTFGDEVSILKKLTENNVSFKGVESNFLDLLERHVARRNIVTHVYTDESFEQEIREIDKLLFVLISNIPIAFKVVDSRTKPWYHIELSWNYLQKQIQIKSPKDLKVGEIYLLSQDSVAEILKGARSIELNENEIFERISD